MVGARARPRDALVLGLTVTITHTIGVFALGIVTLALSEFIVPEDLYPWLNLVSALLVVARRRLGARPALAAAGHTHHHHHDHDHDHDHGHGRGGLLAVGISGGIIPCPTALVVLLAAISLQRVGFGLALIVAFSIGLAAVITGIALLAVARRAFSRMSFEGRLVRALPALSALVILVVGDDPPRAAGGALMFGLDEALAGMSDGTTMLLVLVVAALLGLRHATDPDHVAAVTTLLAARGAGARPRARPRVG